MKDTYLHGDLVLCGNVWPAPGAISEDMTGISLDYKHVCCVLTVSTYIFGEDEFSEAFIVSSFDGLTGWVGFSEIRRY